jgi:hypothetical protein
MIAQTPSAPDHREIELQAIVMLQAGKHLHPRR